MTTTAREDDIAWQQLGAAVARLADVTGDRTRQGTTHHHADGVISTAGTDDAIGFNPIPILQVLHCHGARVVIIGQVAGIMHGSVELTGDLDLLWDGTPEQAAAMSAAFGEVGAELTDNDDKPVPCTAEGFSQAKLTFRTPLGCGTAAPPP